MDAGSGTADGGGTPPFDPGRFRDLKAAGGPPWPPPSATDVVAALSSRMLQDLDRLTDLVVRRIRSEINGYRTESVVLRDDLWWSAYRNAELVLRLLVDDREATDDELRVRRALGVRRAQQGLPVEDVLQAFHTGCLVLWEEIIHLGEQRGQAATAELLRRAGMVWTHMHQISAAVADAHRMEVARRDALAQDGPAALLRALARWPADPAAVDAARDLGFDPEGGFLAAVHRGQTLTGWPEARAVVHQPDRVTVLCAVSGPEVRGEQSLLEVLRSSRAEAIGVGMVRHGLDGAKASLADACRAHQAAVLLGREQMTFRADWFASLVIESREDLAIVASTSTAMFADDEELAATIRTYLDCAGRVSEAARLLNVHPNTVSYRIDRFTRRTGIDPRCPEGALSARLALTLAAV